MIAQVMDSCRPTITQQGFDIMRHVFGGDYANSLEWALQKGLPMPHGARVPGTVSATYPYPSRGTIWHLFFTLFSSPPM
jgi:hypothetical protein